MNIIHKVNNLLYPISYFVKKINYKLIVLFLCILFFIINITSLIVPLRESQTYDENYYFHTGLAILSGKPSKLGETDVAARNIIPASALNVLVSKAISKALPVLNIDKATIKELEIPLGKIATIIVSIILAIYVFRWTFKLYGIKSAFLALTLYILDPNIIAHSRQVHQDIFGACSIFIATYYFWNFLKFGGRINTVLSMITFGIAQISRYTAVYLLPLYFLLAIAFYRESIIRLIKEKQFKIILSNIRVFLFYTILLLATAVLIINIGFSGERTFTKFGDYKFESRAFTALQSSSFLLRNLPVPVPYAYLRGLDCAKDKEEKGTGSGPPYLKGRLGLENGKIKGFKEYYLIAFLYKVPIATQLILVMAVTGIIWNKAKINFWQNEVFLIIPCILYFSIFSFAINAQLGIRYILMIFPFLFVLSSSVALYWTQSRMRYRVFIASLVAYLLISNFSYFPHYLSYFNELLVDRKLGYTILADSNLDWGQNENYLNEYLKKHPSTVFYLNNSLKKHPSAVLKSALLKATVNPDRPQAGLTVIAANDLVGITSNPKRFQWLREKLRPVDHVAYSYLVFNIKPQDFKAQDLPQ